MAPRESLQRPVRVAPPELMQVADDGQPRWRRRLRALAAIAKASNDDGQTRNHEDETED